jgi:hypothetical protein
MNPPGHQEQDLYNAAVALPPDRRAAYLDKACAGDAALRERVEALLKVEKGADAFFASRRSDEDQGTKVLPARPSP